MNRMLLITLLLITATCLTASAQVQSESLTADEIFDLTRSAWQGESFHATLKLEITLGVASKIHVLEVWTLGEDLALIHVIKPVEDAGSGYLEADGKLWYFSPLVGSAIELPAVALAQAVFGSGPSIDDLSHGTLSDDYDVSVEDLTPDGDNAGGWFLTLIPHPDAPVVYGKLDIRVTSDFVIEEIVYYDQRDAVLRTATFSEVIDINGHRVPTRIVIEDASGDRTIQQVVDPEINIDIDETFFTLEALVGETE
ncbi:outer membrane lipoprotein-sorting protein [Candidatus Bipolaricaulota bacterium]